MYQYMLFSFMALSFFYQSWKCYTKEGACMQVRAYFKSLKRKKMALENTHQKGEMNDHF